MEIYERQRQAVKNLRRARRTCLAVITESQLPASNFYGVINLIIFSHLIAIAPKAYFAHECRAQIHEKFRILLHHQQLKFVLSRFIRFAELFHMQHTEKAY
jgi:hypothetical protein